MKNKKGFTIVELVIVIAVIAILAGVLIPTFSGVIQKANDSAALQKATSTMKATLAMSKTAVIADKTYFVIGDNSGIAYIYEFANQAISDESLDKNTTIALTNSGSTRNSDTLAYDRIIINNTLVKTGTSGYTLEAGAVEKVLQAVAGSGKTLTFKARGAELNDDGKSYNTYASSSYDLVIKTKNGNTETVDKVLAVYISSDYAKDVVTFVPATIGNGN